MLRCYLNECRKSLVKENTLLWMQQCRFVCDSLSIACLRYLVKKKHCFRFTSWHKSAHRKEDGEKSNEKMMERRYCLMLISYLFIQLSTFYRFVALLFSLLRSPNLKCGTLGARGFFLAARWQFASVAEGRLHERQSGSNKDLTETGNNRNRKPRMKSLWHPG